MVLQNQGNKPKQRIPGIYKSITKIEVKDAQPHCQFVSRSLENSHSKMVSENSDSITKEK